MPVNNAHALALVAHTLRDRARVLRGCDELPNPAVRDLESELESLAAVLDLVRRSLPNV